MDEQKKPKKIVLLGPTGVGKSSLALALASRKNAEILSADSMQIYKSMDIGTDKPSEENRRHIPHHMIDFLSPFEDYNVKRYVEEAEKRIQEIQSRNKRVIITGGTGLYLRGLLQGIAEDTKESGPFQKEFELAFQKKGIEPLLEQLKEKDPIKYQSLHANDTRRIIRALAYFKANGVPLSSRQKEWTEDIKPGYFLVGLSKERSKLYDAIDARVDRMMEQGLLKEVKALHESKLPLIRTASQAIGYKQLFQHLNGEHSLKEAIRLIKRDSRRYAKRQMTWFSKMSSILWFDVDKTDNLLSDVMQVL